MRPPFEAQTRTYKGELKYWLTLQDAFIYAKSNEDVWKISFPTGSGERCRLVKKVVRGKDVWWVYEDIMTEVLEEMGKLVNKGDDNKK
jgi:hypothetical protein